MKATVVQSAALFVGGSRAPTFVRQTVAASAARSRVVLLIGILLALGVRLAYVWHCNLAYDEYQHMHAAYLVAQGQTPFVAEQLVRAHRVDDELGHFMSGKPVLQHAAKVLNVL